MAFCTKCGASVSDNVAFCQKCGAPQGTAGGPIAAPAVAQSGLSENTAATLSYVLGWLTGIVFFLIDKRPYVRYHAAQSMVTFGGLHAIRIALGITFGVGWWFSPMRGPHMVVALALLGL